MRVIDQIHERSAFTPTEREIASFLEENSKDAIDLSLDELSERIFVSKSTIIRFCKKLGFKGHKDLCVELSKELSVYLMNDRRIDSSFPYSKEDDPKTLADKTYALCYGALAQTYQDLDSQQIYRIAKKICDVKTLWIYTSFDNIPYLQMYAEQFVELGIKAKIAVLSNDGLQKAASQPLDSVALFVVYHTKDSSVIQTAKMLSEKKIPIYVIMGPFRGLLSTYGDEVITLSIYESEPKVVSISSRNSICLTMDILYAFCYSTNLEKNNRTIKEKYDLIREIIENSR